MNPGDELETIIKDEKWLVNLLFDVPADCGCKTYAAQMNDWGVAGCRQRRDKIVEDLTDRAITFSRFGWGHLARSVIRGAIEGRVDDAIRHAAKLQQTTQLPIAVKARSQCPSCGRRQARPGVCHICHAREVCNHRNARRGYQRPSKMPQKQIIAEFVPERERAELDLTVVTATDQHFLGGAYMMIWTLLRSNDCRVVMYDLGIERDHPMRADMERWGVEFRQPPKLLVHRKIRGWQTWNKPLYILDALQDNASILWLDADTAVSDSVADAASHIATHGSFVPDHGVNSDWAASTLNSEPIYRYLPRPKQEWKGNDSPCAGVIGANQNDVEWISDWRERTAFVASRPQLMQWVRFYDQGLFTDVYDGVLQPGLTWNYLYSPRQQRMEHTLRTLYSGDAIITHYGGTRKPWFGWLSLEWGDPA